MIAAAAAVFCYSGWQLLQTMLEYRRGTEEYDRLESMVFSGGAVQASGETAQAGAPAVVLQEPGAEEQPEAIGAAMSYVDFAAVKDMNPDAVAWITLYGTQINYPVVQGEDNEYYLNHTFSGAENAAGTIFIDALLDRGMEEKNVVVYGHNMKNGSMFGTLAYYKNVSMAENYPAFLVHTETGSYEYTVFAAFVTTAGSDTYTYRFGSGEFLDYIGRMKARSLYDTGVEVAAEDKIMTLSTCSGSGDDRFVVLAKRVEPDAEQPPEDTARE